MMFLQISSMAKSFLPFSMENVDPNLHPFMSFSFQNPTSKPTCSVSSHSCLILSSPVQSSRDLKSLHCSAVSRKSNSTSDPEPSSNSKAKPKKRNCRPKTEVPQKDDENQVFPETIPRKPRRGRRSEAVAVEDFIRGSLEKTFASIRQQNSEILENKENVMKDRADEEIDTDSHEDENDINENEDDGGGRGKKMVVEEESPDWPLDADVGWGIRASEYFEKHPIKNVVGEDGVEIDWEGEIDDNWVKEINCLEWESFAFHPSPLIVFVFERYNRATDNWKALKELEKALKVYWSAKDKLPPRSVKIDINIERDLAYALKIRECPAILFLRGNRILYRENEIRTADELVHMIAHFYYNAKRPSWIDVAALS
ncbi:thioredoxin-like fold domain-containing protein MRL7, chloroplastic [Quercus lobata]|uniref:Thioredoxin-like fold domain-containing protein MRL7, chloroplastic n=1 Tax=Quercus lobata TaxID=97700 RepID=A0A7N2MKD9_QUELO|nr:thioredoxin-like fold domain-containing protein MRL7, chloroplastic [Quercus lobata]XP_030935072.1 thioredoxin-like fold domain-containing protein MRL7, chloroplastic [Quercus lobata]XP_030935073.1 thioredoxin-like fold domain-containing protein MRL7, chloroplastic [Quercus lobata]XP_030935074.1 thioredoxin-like fold domain-containing protein MRL7, chloroplastic [Quercus lobata]XP_030935075.1 thioredoxin-like fold domain-containing protein MRL7, chloroplastic [Quercus lobata]XP_030935076.1 